MCVHTREIANESPGLFERNLPYKEPRGATHPQKKSPLRTTKDKRCGLVPLLVCSVLTALTKNLLSPHWIILGSWCMERLQN